MHESLVVAGAVIEEDNKGMDPEEILLPGDGKTESIADLIISPDLTQEQMSEVSNLVEGYRDIFTDRPGKTCLIEHEIRVTDETPVRQAMYATPFAIRDTIQREVKHMLDLKIIEKSQSP